MIRKIPYEENRQGISEFAIQSDVGDVRIYTSTRSVPMYTTASGNWVSYASIGTSTLALILGFSMPVVSIVLSIVSLVGSAIDVSRPVQARTMVSHLVHYCDGEVWNGVAFVLAYRTAKRDSFKHYWSQYFDTAGYARQGIRDEVPPSYAPFTSQQSANYNNASVIRTRAYQYYMAGNYPVSEAPW